MMLPALMTGPVTMAPKVGLVLAPVCSQLLAFRGAAMSTLVAPSGSEGLEFKAIRIEHAHLARRPCAVPPTLAMAKLIAPSNRGFAAQAVATQGTNTDTGGVPESTLDDGATERKLGGKNTPGTSQGQDQSFASGYIAPHPGMRAAPSQAVPVDKESFMEHPEYYDMKYLESIKPIHLPPKDAADRAGLLAVKLLRKSFDVATGYGPNMTEAKWLNRVLFLETVAGVPGMVAGMLRHLHSLRLFRRDQGWIHTLLEEAENERMHLLTFFELRKPGPLFRAMVLLGQGVFFNAYFITYLLWPKACHAFVGYLEEEAVRTYTHLLKDIDEGKVWKNAIAPPIAQSYWHLKANASMRDLILAVRADEACHSHVNHTLKKLKATEPNPFAFGQQSQLP